MKQISVQICDDIEDIRAYFQNVLSKEPNIRIVGTAKSGAEAVRLALREKPDIVLMDIQMETQDDGITAIEQITEALPETKCIVLTIHAEDEYLYRAYAAGAADFITKTDSIARIVQSINDVYKNTLPMRPEIASRLIKEFSRMKSQQDNLVYVMHLLSKLTNSELGILRMVYYGGTYEQISESRHIELSTVKTQVRRILHKFGKKRMKDVTALLRECRLFESYDFLNKE